MNPIEAVATCYRKYFQFSGRATRSEFWWFYGFCLVSPFFASLIRLGQISGMLWLVSLLPFVASSFRRMHDGGSAGGLIIIPFLIQVASVYVFLFGRLNKMMPHMAELDFTDDTTISELQSMQLDALTKANLEEITFASLLPAFFVFSVGFCRATYLLCRPSQPNTNQYGPNPHEVPQ